jgi:hypothetical protein
MDLLKRVAGIVIGLAVGYLVIQVFIGGDKLATFKEFRSDEGGFTVLMPGKPKAQNQTLDSPVGQVKMVMYMAGSSKAGCAVAYADYPAQLINSTDPQKTLDGARNGAIKNVNGKLISETSINFHGLPARDVRIEIPKKALITARLILAGPRFYQLMFIAPTDKEHEQDISQFLNSFTIDGVK